MDSVFIDTVAWIALLNADDELHSAALVVMRRLQTERSHLVTTEFVLLELADALSAPAARRQTVNFIDGLRQLPLLTILSAEKELFHNGWALYSQRPDKNWSLTDCTSFAVMSTRRISQAFTADRHFEQAGFVRLLT